MVPSLRFERGPSLNIRNHCSKDAKVTPFSIWPKLVCRHGEIMPAIGVIRQAVNFEPRSPNACSRSERLVGDMQRSKEVTNALEQSRS
jgi:hypothetical protein